MNRSLATALAALLSTAAPILASTTLFGGETATGFEKARRPIGNPTLFDLALPGTNLHPMFLYQRLPAAVSTPLGDVPLDGDLQVYALQFEVALTPRLSLVATKDGYVDFNPEGALWSEQQGFANLGAGLKYAFYLDPAEATVFSGTLSFELPTGNRDVFQGQGDGAAQLILSGLKLWDRLQWAGAAGVQLPFDGEMATRGFLSTHLSYEICPWLIPLAEIHWHHVLDSGSGRSAFPSQAGGLVPAVATFEGSDLLNFGTANAGDHPDLVTAVLGIRSRLREDLELGVAYEKPLTAQRHGLIEDRITLDLVWKF